MENLTVTELVDLLEKNIRYGCHSARAEASRSSAGKELQRRAEMGDITVVEELSSRLRVVHDTSLEKRVQDGLDMLLGWIKE